MTSAEYQQLVDFLGRQFTEIDHRFTEIGGRFTVVDRRFDEMASQLADLRRDMLGHFDVAALQSRIEHIEQRLSR